MNRKMITLSRIIKTGLVNFIRNAWLAVAAMAVMTVTLTIVLFSLITNATFANTIAQITDKIDISVYLQDDISASDRDAFIKGIKALPNAKSVTYLSKDQTLENYQKQNACNAELASINKTLIIRTDTIAEKIPYTMFSTTNGPRINHVLAPNNRIMVSSSRRLKIAI